MKLSILTATYNRGNLLKRLYKSILDNILEQMEIEWIIVNDGSTDETEEVIKEFIKENKIEIKYFYQENLGKMAAINVAVKESSGEIIVDCDSDDYFAKNAFKKIYENIGLLFANIELYALCFLKQNEKGEISGKKFKENYLISTLFDLNFKDDVGGEKILVFKSDIRKEFKHEIEFGEKFITEARMYYKMDEKYKLLCINEVIEIGDYLDDGYTKNSRKNLIQNPNGYYNYFKEILKRDLKRCKY